MWNKSLLIPLFLLLFSMVLSAQIMPMADKMEPEEYDPAEFPLWTWDLRRFEVITFGSLPLTFLLTSLVYDFTLYAVNDFSTQYTMGSQRGEADLAIILSSAAILSAAVAVTDLIITLARRSKVKKQAKNERKGIARPAP